MRPDIGPMVSAALIKLQTCVALPKKEKIELRQVDSQMGLFWEQETPAPSQAPCELMNDEKSGAAWSYTVRLRANWERGQSIPECRGKGL